LAAGAIAAGDLDLVTICDDPDEVVALIRAGAGRAHRPPETEGAPGEA
jgi:hypothetical protein